MKVHVDEHDCGSRGVVFDRISSSIHHNIVATAFRIISEHQNKSGIQINIRMMRYDTVIIRTVCVFSGY